MKSEPPSPDALLGVLVGNALREHARNEGPAATLKLLADVLKFSGPDALRRGLHAGGAARRGRTSQAAREAVNLRDALFDQERLSRQTYLTIPELCAYGRFPTEQAVYQFLRRYPREVPKVRQGRTIQVLRRDYDESVQSRKRAKP
jgi:hypothetical protein